MLTRLTAMSGRLRSSLFFLPMVCVLLGVVLAEIMLGIDAMVSDIDSRWTATVESARTVLTTIAGATLTFAGTAFSVSLLLLSLASSQYSPRVVHGMFRDPFNKRVMGLVIGTFTYCLIVLRAVRSSLEGTDEPIVPSVSILLAVVLGIASILAIIAFINHAAHSMDVSKILRRVTREALSQAERCWPEDDAARADDPVPDAGEVDPPPTAAEVRFTSYGWVQRIDVDAVQRALPPGARARFETFAGRYAVPHTPLARVWPAAVDDDLAAAIRSAVTVGETRTMDQDVAYGIRQLVDVALKAMSPGVNDPTTAHDAMVHAGTVLAALLRRVPPADRRVGPEGQVLLFPHATTYADLVELTFDEMRLACADHPAVLVQLLDVMAQVLRSLDDLDRPDATSAVRRQADLIRDALAETDLLPADRRRVEDAFGAHFAS